MKLPQEFEKRMKEYLGDEYEAFIASYDEPEVKGLRFNTEAPGEILGALCDGEDFGERGFSACEACGERRGDGVGQTPIPYAKIPWAENGYFGIGDRPLYQNQHVRPGKHPYHEAGAYYIQEPSAMAPATYLDARPGERVLDLCAAPGGKSTQLAYMMKGEGILISNEIMPDRAKILSENIERMGVKNALVISEDPRDISGRFEAYFDKILVDAPCSGEGMFRRSETAVNEWSPENVTMCGQRQAWILDEAAKMLRAGGRLVYSTCTFSKTENEETINAFLARHDDFFLAEMKLYDGMRQGFDGVGIRLWPHLISGEGHYVCALEKNGYRGQTPIPNTPGERRENGYRGQTPMTKTPPPCGYERGLNKKDVSDLKDMYEFFRSNIPDKDILTDKTLVRFKDQIYMLPDECPSLNGIKVIRAGLHLGEMKKNRFEPAHALAKTLKSTEIKNSCILTLNNGECYKYLNGETFYMPLPNGWYVIYIGEFPLGWGKITNEIMKNHYPKGLRKQLLNNRR